MKNTDYATAFRQLFLLVLFFAAQPVSQPEYCVKRYGQGACKRSASDKHTAVPVL
jgi:hypothetical protein